MTITKKRLITVLAIFVALGFAGFTSLMAAHHTPPKVTITVEQMGGVATIKADPDRLVLGNPGQRKNIIFMLDSSTYRFPPNAADAIIINQGSDRQFGPPSHSQGGNRRVITVRGENSNEKEYKYTIKLIGPNGEELILDPLIKNGNP